MDNNKPIEVKVIKRKPNLVDIELLPGSRRVEVPTRLFDKRRDMGIYKVLNEADDASVI